jgi:hypothetical protein
MMSDESPAHDARESDRLNDLTAQAEREFLERTAASEREFKQGLKRAKETVHSPEGRAMIAEAELMFRQQSEGAARRFNEALQLARRSIDQDEQ